MKAGKLQQLVDWTVEALVEDPTTRILIAVTSVNQGRMLLDQIRDALPGKVKVTRYTRDYFRTEASGGVDVAVREESLRGYRVDHFWLHHDAATQRMMEAGVATEKTYNPKATRTLSRHD